jgi:hypothetical protein
MEYLDPSQIAQLVLDGSTVGNAFIVAIAMSAENLTLLSVKHCPNIQLSTVKHLLDATPHNLRTLMVWGLPNSAWLCVPDRPGIPNGSQLRDFPHDIISLMRRCTRIGLDIDVGYCTARSHCRGLAAAIRRMNFDPQHDMFRHQPITKASIMMCERRSIECAACGIVKVTLACLECMTAGKISFGFCGACEW